MTEVPERPITLGERQAYDAATQGTPRQYEQCCRRVGIDPIDLLNRFDAEPWRWIIYWLDTKQLSPLQRATPYPLEIRAKLDAVRAHLDAPRRLFGRRR
jgi:hypothetical protein